MDDFDKQFEATGQRIEKARKEMDEKQLELAKTRRVQSASILMVTSAGIVVVGFACWCVYHVLKTKGLVP